MKVMSRYEPETSMILVNIVLTEEEVKKLIDGKVVTGEDEDVKAGLKVQIVGYGDEQNKD